MFLADEWYYLMNFSLRFSDYICRDEIDVDGGWLC